MENALITFVISLMAFYAIDINTELYFMAIVACIAILRIKKYSLKKNIELYSKVNMVLGGNFCAFFAAEYCKGYLPQWDWKGKIYCGYVLLLAAFGVYLFIQKSKDEKETEKQEEKELFRERRYDRERILDYLKAFNIVGVNGPWGSGKSFVVDHLGDIGYKIVKIDLLACNLDEIQTVLLNEIEKALRSEKIFSAYSPKLKKILKQEGLIRNVGEIFVRDDITYSEALTGFSEDLKKLDHILLIVFEDLDRVEKIDIIKKVLGISEKLVNNRIKVIYQYDENNLLNHIEIDRKYLEKYIPVTVNLTEVSFSSILKYLFTDECKYIEPDDFKFLKLPIYSPSSLRMKYNISFTLEIPGITIRKMENFFREIMIYIEKDRENAAIYRDNKRATIVFFLVKYFFEDVYNKLIPGKKISEIFTLDYNNRTDTIDNWLVFCKKNKVDFSDIWGSEENYQSAIMLSLFQYHCDVFPVKKELNALVNESVRNIQAKNANEQINRIVWNLLCNGKSEYTDQRIIIARLQKEVLIKPLEKQTEAFEEFWNRIYNGELKENEKADNTTIFKLGVPSMVSLFQASRVAGITSEQWIQFLNFYFSYKKIEAITPEVVECLNYCEIEDRKVYLHIIKKFNSLNIVGNMNRHKAYQTFLDMYLTALARIGYVDVWERDLIKQEDERVGLDPDEIGKYVFKPLKERIGKLRETIPVEKIRDDIQEIENFIDKNMLLMQKNRNIDLPELKFNTKAGRRLPHQERVNELIKSGMSPAELEKVVEKEYEKGTLSAYEINKIYLKRQKKKVPDQ